MNGSDKEEKYKIRKKIEELANKLDKIESKKYEMEELYNKIEFIRQEVMKSLSLLGEYEDSTRRIMEEDILKYERQGNLNEQDIIFLDKIKKKYLENQSYSVEVA